jgi:hypothetical protein
MAALPTHGRGLAQGPVTSLAARSISDMTAPEGNNKHHYLSQFFLERWTRPVDPPRQPFLYVYERGRRDPRTRAPGNIAWERGLYRVHPEAAVDGDPETVELALSQHESYAKHAFDAIDATGRLDDPQHITAVANFLALFLLRTRKGLLGLERRAREMAETMPDELLSRPGYVRRLQRQALAEGARPEQVTREKLMEAARGAALRVSENREWRIARIFSLAQKASAALISKHWCVVGAETPAQFIVSDAPVLVPWMGDEQAWWKAPPVGIAQDGAEVWFPLDPDHALLASSKWLPPTTVLAASAVDQLNRFSMQVCLDFVIAHRPRPKIAEFMAALAPSDGSLSQRSAVGRSA